MKVRELLSDASKWTQGGAYALCRLGTSVEPRSSFACKFCLAGAVYHCYPDSYEAVLGKIRNYLGNPKIISWNDNPSRTFSEVKTLAETLDI